MGDIKLDEVTSIMEVGCIRTGLVEIHLGELTGENIMKHVDLHLVIPIVSNTPLPSWREIVDKRLNLELPDVVRQTITEILVDLFNTIYSGVAVFNIETFTLVNSYPEGTIANKILTHFYNILTYSINECNIPDNELVSNGVLNVYTIKIPIKFDLFFMTNMNEMVISKELFTKMIAKSSKGNIVLYDPYTTKYMAKDLFETNL
ncbi:MAG: hypothetical protein DRP93_01235 [Candidatus Neomarinimicrobiota bacterium]|nr:MAG: hypothetical protein DRP93_01235 [Candidatus Neomarinimicrobiota bacterium]